MAARMSWEKTLPILLVFHLKDTDPGMACGAQLRGKAPLNAEHSLESVWVAQVDLVE